MASIAFGVVELRYGDKVYIINFKTKLYSTQDGNLFVGRKNPSDKASFIIVADIENPNLKKGEIIKYGNSMYFQSSATRTPTFIGDSGEQKLIYKMKRRLLGLVTSVEKNKIYKFTILPSVGKKENQTVYYGEKINLQYYLSSSKSPIKYFRFTTGGKVFGSDDSKWMTKAQIKETKELIFEKAWEKGKTPITDKKGPVIGEKLNYYKVLSVDKNADNKTIDKKYRQISLKIHPDKVDQEDREKAEEAFKLVGTIKDILSNPDNRKIYDEWLKKGGATPQGIVIVDENIYNFIQEKTK